MEIRRLAVTDAAAWHALRLRALREHPEAFTSSAEEHARNSLDIAAARLAGSVDRRFWGAFDGERLCGMVGLEREARAKARHLATIVGMYVAPESSGQGVGRLLLQAVVEDARSSGVELLVLTVTDGNQVAGGLYQRAGFRSFGILPGAIRVDGRALAKNHMYLGLGSS